MFVRFDCGCLGLANVQGGSKGHAIIIKPCDLPAECYPEDTSFYFRDMSDKGTQPLSDEASAKIVDEVSRLIAQGHKFQAVRNLLR